MGHAASRPALWIDTMVNVGAYWRGQQLVTAATAGASDGASAVTWTWTLPPHFPPGHYLRATSAGGTLSQKGAALPRHERGYYEIALDAGSLTWTPDR